MASAARDMAEGKPLEGVVKLMNALSYVFLLLIVASAIVWIIWVAYGRQDKDLIDFTTAGGSIEAVETKDKKTLGNENQEQIMNTINVAFQALVASCLVYFVFRHHFSHMHY